MSDIEKDKNYGLGYAEGVYDTKIELLPKISELKQELETYKKIAYKLASVLSKRGIVYFEPVEPYKERTPIKKVALNGKDEIIDWARNEVLKDE